MDNNLVGQTIQGRYYVVSQLGRGGVGITFLAQDQQCFDSPCVVKQLKPKSENPKTLEIARRLFNREAEIMNRLGHSDRIPRLLAYFEQDNDFFLVQELIEGHDLSHEIIADQPWSEEKSITLLKDILEGLMYVQENSVIHRDLKPSNLMRRSKDKKIILIDFGSVKQVSTQIVSAAGRPQPTVSIGTRSYMPMEQMIGHPGFYSDIYAVGIIVIQALTGVVPKDLNVGHDGEIIWRSKLSDKINYQPQFLDILDKMVRQRFQTRYDSAKVVLSDLKCLDTVINNQQTVKIVADPVVTSSSAPEFKTLKKAVGKTKITRVRDQQFTNNQNHQDYPRNFSNFKAKSRKHKSKKMPAIAGILALLASALGAWILFPKNTPDSKVKLSPYENTEEGFRVGYPETWTRQNQDDFFATGVTFFAPLENDSDQFKERVSVLVENLDNDTSLAKYTNESITQIKKLSDPGVGKAQVISLDHNEARKIVYRGEEHGYNVERMQTWSIKNNRAYVITYTAEPGSYNAYLPTVKKIIESFATIQ